MFNPFEDEKPEEISINRISPKAFMPGFFLDFSESIDDDDTPQPHTLTPMAPEKFFEIALAEDPKRSMREIAEEYEEYVRRIDVENAIEVHGHTPRSGVSSQRQPPTQPFYDDWQDSGPIYSTAGGRTVVGLRSEALGYPRRRGSLSAWERAMLRELGRG